ncbi:MAG: AI-2E family transporter [Bacteroidota bacterium]
MKQLAYAVIGIGGILALLILGESTLIPFTYGVVLWFLSRYFTKLINQVPLIKKYAPAWSVSTLAFITVILVLGLVAQLIVTNIESLISSSDQYEASLQRVVDRINEQFQFDLYSKLMEQLQGLDYQTILGNVADSLSGALGNTAMVLIYAAFIFSEESSFMTKIRKLFPKQEDYEHATGILKKINDSAGDYIRLKTLVSLLTGAVGWVFLSIMGVEAAFFWAFLMFALNYIPTIGSLIATLFPAVFSLLQFGEIQPFIIILVGLGAIELLIGNVLEPRIMGKSLNLSPLVTILALVVWGVIWGITCMLLSTPITVIMVIIFSQFERTRP